MRSLPHRGGDLIQKDARRRLRQSPSLDGVLDEQLERPLSVPHFGSSLDVSVAVGGSDESNGARETEERSTLPSSNNRDSANLGAPSTNSHSSSNLHSFKQVIPKIYIHLRSIGSNKSIAQRVDFTFENLKRKKYYK